MANNSINKISNHVLPVLLLGIASTNLHAATYSNYDYETNGGTITITRYHGPGGALTIPDTINGLPVSSIGNGAFAQSTLTSAIIPASVTNIGVQAFSRCTSLSNVKIPNGPISIREYAFLDCDSLTNITIGTGIISIGTLAFGYCDSLRAITVDPLNSLYTSVDGVLFDKNTNTLLQVPGGKTGSYTIPASVTNIAYGAFIECKSLTSVTIPDNVTNLGYSAFYFCSGLTNVSLPSTITGIGGDAFGFCTNLASLTIPSAVTSIGWGAFSYCHSLTSITIPNGVTNIGGQAFYGCTGLTNVTIGSGVTQIRDEAFVGCASLTSITIPDSVTRLDFMAFAGCTGLRNVSIGNSVTIIEDSVFWGCTGLTNLTIPSSVTTIMDGTFAACTALTSLYFEGNAPAVPYPDWSKPFDGSPFVTVFYRSGTTGWGSTYADRPTALWLERPSYADWAVSTGLVAQFPAASGEGDDADGDGFTNGDEWFAGTDPTQSASRLELELAPRPADLTASDQTPLSAGEHAVYFRSVPGRYYGIQSTASLGGAWTLQTTRVASTTQTRFVLPASGSQIFYRVLALP